MGLSRFRSVLFLGKRKRYISGHIIGGSWSSRSVFSRLGFLGIYNDFTLIASVVGESVIGHGIGGINFPDIMARLAKMQDRWSKR